VKSYAKDKLTVWSAFILFIGYVRFLTFDKVAVS